MTLTEQVNERMKDAMKSREKEALEALRAIKSAILLAVAEVGPGHQLTQEDEIKLLQRLQKQRKDSIEIFRAQNRADLFEVEEAQLKIIEGFLPKQLEGDELKAEMKAIVEELGATSIKDMGRVMAEANKRLAGRADGKSISAAVKEMLG
jgi:uncharacterized protein YqeY